MPSIKRKIIVPVLKPKLTVKKLPRAEMSKGVVNTLAVGKMIEKNLGRIGVGITSLVLTAINRRIEDTRLRRPAEKHQMDLEPWRIAATHNLINVLRESVEVRKTNKNGNIRYNFLLGEKTFLNIHTGGSARKNGYWALLNYGGKISIDAVGVPGYFGGGVLPSATRGGKESFHYTGPTSFKTKKQGGPSTNPKGTRLTLMIPKKSVIGINFIGAGYEKLLELSKKGAVGIKKTSEKFLLRKLIKQRVLTREETKEMERLYAKVGDDKYALADPKDIKAVKTKAKKIIDIDIPVPGTDFFGNPI